MIISSSQWTKINICSDSFRSVTWAAGSIGQGKLSLPKHPGVARPTLRSQTTTCLLLVPFPFFHGGEAGTGRLEPGLTRLGALGPCCTISLVLGLGALGLCRLPSTVVGSTLATSRAAAGGALAVPHAWHTGVGGAPTTLPAQCSVKCNYRPGNLHYNALFSAVRHATVEWEKNPAIFTILSI